MVNFLNAQTKVNFITEYYPFINKAEIYITKGKFENALEMYQKAFKNSTIGFRRDYENALYCALKIDKINIALEYAKQMAVKGSKLEYFKKIKHFEKLTASNNWIDFEENYDKYYLKNINIKLRDTLIKMKERDQKYRLMEGSYRKYHKEIKEIDSLNYIGLVSLFNQYGYPTEDMIGGKHITDVIIRHYYQNNPTDTTKHIFLNDIFNNALKEGKIHNENILTIFNNIHPIIKWEKYSYYTIKKVNNLVYRINFGSTLEINKERKEIGLCSMEDVEQKLLFYYSPILYEKVENFFESSEDIYKTQPFYFWVHSYILYTPDEQYDFKQQIKTKQLIPIPNPNKK
ncbi:MAG: hypothetical protein EAZ31_05645 [Cytophagia bacterium]|nr:MAG: hypothetical protein EAZ31_05645 [Cytophagia bacterium]